MFDNVTTETIHTTHRHNRTVSFGRSLEGGAFVVKLISSWRTKRKWFCRCFVPDYLDTPGEIYYSAELSVIQRSI